MLLTAHDLVKTYSFRDSATTTVLRGACISVEHGEFVAIVGPSGAGKSTLLHALSSLETIDSGEINLEIDSVVYEYQTMSESSLALLRAKHIGMVYQFHHLLPEFTARENIMMPLLILGQSHKVAKQRADELLEMIGLGHRTEHLPTELSGGEQQRVAIARAVANRPSLLFADEPTGNLDSANADVVRTLLRDLQAEYRLTCIVATHSDSLMNSASRIVQMKDGICTE